jgi:hypothetical protein
MKQWKAVVAALSVIGSMTVMTPAAQASPDPNLTVTNVTLGRTTAAVSGLNLVAVPVTVTAKYGSPDGYDPFYLDVILDRLSGTGVGAMIATKLTLASGTPQAGGIWKGLLYVPSTATGTYKVIGVLANSGNDDGVGSGYSETPFSGPGIAVTGSHQPKLSVSIIPKIVPFGSPYKVRVTVYDSATGKPYGTRINVQVTGDNLCVESDGDRYLTNTAGIVERTYSAAAAEFLNCVRLRSPGLDILSLSWYVLRPGVVGATPTRTSAPVGTVVPVKGTVGGAPQTCPVILQRLLGATQWRTVSEGKVTSSGRFTVLAQPPFAGNVVYRVSFPVCHQFQAGVSKSFVIRGL